MSASTYLGQAARLRLLELGGRSPSYQDAVNDEAENLRKRLLSGPTVDIYVGPERKQWSLHRNLLCHHSSYFETELQGHEVPKKLADSKLELPDYDPVGFELLVKWLYQGQLEDASGMSDEAKYDYAVACHKLYLLCDKFDMIRLKNIAMDQYRICLNDSQLVPDADEINEIYRSSPAGSAFRSLMINIAARQIMDPDVERDAEAYRKCFENNPDFAIEMINAVRNMSGGILFDDPTEGKPCDWHDHNDVSGCRTEGKGKERQAKAGAEGLSRQQYMAMPPVAELSAERRTPRKLNTPLRTKARSTKPDGPVTPSVNQSLPRQPETKTNGDARQDMSCQLSKPRGTPKKLERRTPKAKEQDPTKRQADVQTSPFDDTSPPDEEISNGGHWMSSLENKDVEPNETETSPTLTRSGNRRERENGNDGVSPPPKMDLPPRLDESRSRSDTVSTVSTLDNESVRSLPSRKRKYDEGTSNPAKKHLADSEGGLDRRPTLDQKRSSGASTTSGPPKLSRVSSIASKFDSSNGVLHVIDGREVPEKRRPPPKLRLGSGPMGMR